jgi:tyrosine-protein phosphatase YwqE
MTVQNFWGQLATYAPSGLWRDRDYHDPHIIQHVWDNTHEGIASKKVETIQQLEKQHYNSFPSRSRVPDGRSVCTAFQSHDLLTLKDNYVLVEMSYINAPIQLYSILFDLQVAGYIPVLAHPERYLFYHNNFNEYVKLKEPVCLFQLNLLSVVGYYGPQIKK